ncbi:T9SS type A sorting domain-containing protein [candidate division KSB1 bacterium]|nr:T9SS type A sorting domain-containing protein [candidate division KSB1 bacterium]
MKRILMFLLLIGTRGFAQIDSTALSFYPLTTGNYWEYKETIFEYPYIFDEHYFSVEVIGDTLLTNGKTYKILKRAYLDSLYTDFCYERVDSLTGNAFRCNNIHPYYDHDEYLIDSLYATVGDTCYSNRIFHIDDSSQTLLYSEDLSDLFNQKLLVRKLFGITWVPGYEYQLAQKIGLRKLIAWSESRSTEIALQYAYIDGIEYGERVDVGITTQPQRPRIFKLYQNYPNPFNPDTRIRFNLPKSGHTHITIYDIQGREVAVLLDAYESAGEHVVHWNGVNRQGHAASSGVYFYQVKYNDSVVTKKMVLVQ